MPSQFVISRARRKLLLTDRYVREEVAKACNESGSNLQAKFDTAVSDWEGKPRFTWVLVIRPTFIGVTVMVLGRHRQKFKWVNYGTSGPYPIPKFPGAKPLRFQLGYQAHTRPVAQHHQGAGEATGGWASKYQVMHPGIEKRDFTGTYPKEERPVFRRNVHNAFRRGISKANRG